MGTQTIEFDSDDEESIETTDTDTPIETTSIETLLTEEAIEAEAESEPESEHELPQETTQAPRLPLQKAPRDINLDLDESNIIEGRTRTSAANARREAYIADLQNPETYPGFQAAFTAGIEYKKQESQLHRDNLPPPPKSWKKLQKHPYKEGFLAAAKKEYQDLERRNTWKLTPKPTGNTQILPLKWVFTYKFDSDGFLLKYKARLCVRGDLQRSIHQDNAAATLAAKTFRALMAIIAAFGLHAIQLDAVNAFTNSKVDETVYCQCPEGFEQAELCLLLLLALYGLRRSPLLWLKEFSSTLIQLGLHQVPEEPCLYTNGKIIVFFYVDDIVILGQDLDLIHQFKEELLQRYEMRDLGDLSWFLGIRIIRDWQQGKLWLCQDSYIEKIATSFHLESSKPVYSPLTQDELVPYDGQASPQDIYTYQRKVGSLQYTATITRPDIACTTSKLSEFLQNPGPRHQEAIDRAINYAYNSRHLAIEYSADTNEQNVFVCASDAAFGDDLISRRSTEGYLFQLFSGPIDWHSTRQKTVTTSSTEAELLALSHAAKETYWWKRLFKSIELDPGHQSSINCDNTQTIRLLTAESPQLTTKLRHVDIHNHWLRQEVQRKNIYINWIPTAKMPADGLTKALPRQKHETFVRLLGLVNIKDKLQA